MHFPKAKNLFVFSLALLLILSLTNSSHTKNLSASETGKAASTADPENSDLVAIGEAHHIPALL